VSAGRFIAFVVACIAGLACASMETPPGGPPDSAPPVLVNVTPDTNAVNVRPKAVVFRFDEVVSERPRTATKLDEMVLISPATGAPNVDWKREAIEVRPRKGWRPNTTYTVTLLPGLGDLRNNVRTEGASVIFSTGPSIATSAVRGLAFDWVAGKPAPGAYIEAISHPDSIVYVATADSSGTFVVRNIPPGEYTVRALVDLNRNRDLDPRELWDSVHVTVSDSARVEMLTHAHDTIPPRIDQVAARDTFTLRVTLDRPLDPGMTVDTSLFTLVGPDSSIVPLAEARAAAVYERLQAERDRARADSVARAAPPLATGERAPRPGEPAQPITAVTPSKPSPVSEVIIVASRALRPGATYRLRARGLRGIMGTARDSEREFKMPEAPKPAVTPPAGRGNPPPAGGAPPPAGRCTIRAAPFPASASCWRATRCGRCSTAFRGRWSPRRCAAPSTPPVAIRARHRQVPMHGRHGSVMS
jgi:hypothetical protein